MRKAVLATLFLVAAAPLHAQEDNVVRRIFTFLDSRLTVDVLVESPGVLRMIRGEAGEVQVAARASRGFAGFGLAGRGDNELKLTALGADHVEYLVIVPERVRVSVRMPDRYRAETFASTSDNATFIWDATGEARDRVAAAAARPDAEPRLPDAARADRTAQAAPERNRVPADEAVEPGYAYFTAYAGAPVPELISLPETERISSVTVRVEGERFRIDASRPMRLTPGDPRVLEIRPEGEPMHIVIYLPDNVPQFIMRLGNVPAFAMQGRDPAVFCTPVIEQWLDDGRRWYTFSPRAGRLRCGGQGTEEGVRVGRG